MELLEIARHERDGWTVIEVVGQIDAATAPGLRQALMEAQYGGSTRLLLHLDGTEFIDSIGLGVIVGALKRARTHGGEFVVACARERILQLFELTRLAEIVPMVADPAEVTGS